MTKLKTKPGFFLIPHFDNYAINKKGNVFNIKNESMLYGNVNPAGYFNYRIKNNDNKTITMGRHVLLKRTFDWFDGCEAYVVDHRNTIKGDDRLLNLRWGTQQDNMHFAGEAGVTEKCKPVVVIFKEGGNKEFPSMKACAKDLGIHPETVKARIDNGYDKDYKISYKRTKNET